MMPQSPPHADPQRSQYLLFCDDLTGLYNRRFYDRAYVEQTARARENQTPLGLLLIDLDFFKNINDRHGHQEGDAALKTVGRIINEIVDIRGYPIRYAGDEFLVLLPASTADEAVECAERLRHQAREEEFRTSTSRVIKLSFSIGVAHYPTDTENPESLFENADQALYLAKRKGRDRVMRFDAKDHVVNTATLFHYFPCPRLVGRDDVLAHLYDAFSATSVNAPRPWVILSGAAGMGKTRMVGELRLRSDPHRGILMEAAAATYRSAQPYSLMLDALSAYHRMHPAALQQMAQILTTTEVRAVSRLLPEFAHHAMLSSDGAGAQPARNLDEVWCKMLGALSQECPVNLVLDDFHHADADSVRTLTRLRERCRAVFVCLVVREDDELTQEIESFLRSLRGQEDVVDLQLQPLSSGEVSDMIDAILPEASSHPQLQQFVFDKSKGVPMLVEEVLKLLIQSRCVAYHGSSLTVGALDEQEVPEGPEMLLEVRAARAVPLRSVAAASPKGADGMLRPGAALGGGRYLVERLIAAGGMSMVYRGTVPALGGKPVAIKELRLPSFESSVRARAVEQFQREAHLLATLDHPGLVAVMDYFEEDGSQFLVMPFLDGPTLQAVLDENEGLLGVDRVVGWALELCDALEYLHSQEPPVLFRDLKPSNVVLDLKGRLRLIDFGIAQALDPDVGTHTFLRGAGTTGFAPVEQCSGTGGTDARSDIYALGATMMNLLTGRVPPSSVAIMSGEARLRRPSELNTLVPRWLDDLVARMMAQRKEDRPTSVAEVRRAFQARTSPTRPMPILPQGTQFASGFRLRATAGAAVGQIHVLDAGAVWIGRGEPAESTATDLFFSEPSVSRRQAQLLWEERPRRYVLKHNAKATNPTFVNGRAAVSQPLKIGDVIAVGHLRLVLEPGVSTSEPARAVDSTGIWQPVSEPDATGAWMPLAAFSLQVLSGGAQDRGRVFPLATGGLQDGRRITIGGPNATAVDIRLSDDTLTDRCARLEMRDESIYLVGSSDATPPVLVNGSPLQDARALQSGDCISWGRTVLAFSDGQSTALPACTIEVLRLPQRSVVATFTLTGGRQTIGRADDCGLRVDDSTVSRVHAAVEWRHDGYWLRHLSKTNPTIMNGVRLHEERLLADGDEFQISGQTALRFSRSGQ